MTQLKLKTADFRRALDVVRPALERKVTIPILSTVKLEGRDGTLSMLATNLDLSVRVQMQDAYTGDGMAVVGERLMTWVKLQDAEEMKLTEQSNGRVLLSCGRGGAKVPTMAVASFPQVQVPAQDHNITMRQGELLRALKLVAFAISHEESRYTLNGALLEVVSGELRLVATDGHRLSLYRVPVEGSPDTSIMIPAGLCKVLLGMLSDTDETVRVWWDEGSIGLSMTRESLGIIEVVARRMTGRFPNYSAVLPLDTDRMRFTLPAALLLRAIQRTASFADSSTGAVRMTFGPKSIAVYSVDKEAGEADDCVEVETGLQREVVIGLNGSYILEALAKMSGDVTVGVKDPQHSLLLHSTPSEGTTMTYVVMPMHIAGK